MIAGNDVGTIIIFDLARGVPIDLVQTCQQRAIWTLDVDWDDNILAVGTEVGSIELYNLKKLMRSEP